MSRHLILSRLFAYWASSATFVIFSPVCGVKLNVSASTGIAAAFSTDVGRFDLTLELCVASRGSNFSTVTFSALYAGTNSSCASKGRNVSCALKLLLPVPVWTCPTTY